MTETSQDDYSIREASEADFPGIADFLTRHNYSPTHLDWSQKDYLNWLRWKFLTNPDGSGRMFIVEDSDNAVVGIRGDIPRRFTSAKTGIFLTYQGVDLLVDAGHREKGLYSKLREFAWSNLDLPKVSFPSRHVLGIILRHGFRIIAPAEKWVFPGSSEESTSGKVHRLFSSLVAMGKKLYALLWLGPHPNDLRMEPVARFNRDFDIDPAFIHGVRSAEYLNWRFIDNPMYDYSVFEFFEGDQSIGYCVYSFVRSKTEIYDFIATRRQRSCLRLLVEHCHALGITGLGFKGIGLKLGRFGFLRRRDRDTYYTGHEAPEGDWMLTTADRDY